ncbi:MAG: hypothetical protein IIA88_01385 [Bacteroidetes bacterium]|nr:hypothetical protein [Bacteroidota bacterium]
MNDNKEAYSDTRCKHYNSESDIIAIKFRCCSTWYPCYLCHQEMADHAIQVWKKDEFDAKAILCGRCGNELTIHQYLSSNNKCVFCNVSFNPKCSRHHHLYFEI